MTHLQDTLTKEYLTHHYIALRKTHREIANELGLRSTNSVVQYLKKFGLNRPPIRNSRQVLTKDYLLEHYVRLQKSMVTIAREVGVRGKGCVKRALMRHGIPIRDASAITVRRVIAWQKKRKGAGEITGHYWANMLGQARWRELEVDITPDYAWKLFLEQDRRCALSGVLLVFYKPGEKMTTTTASLDRIDSTRGYVVGNVQWVHKRIQRMKMNLVDINFIEWCRMVATHNKAV